MAARTKARKLALDILFAAELREERPADVLAQRGRPNQDELAAYDHAVRIVEGVQEHRERIDELLATYATGWTLDRMPAVDRNILRMGVYELLWLDDVPDGAAVSEAVKLATELSTDESPRFVNGLLARLQQLKPSLTL
ncbi:transcription antitermination factor NusB [Actinomadura parmotrematis]|uniref:Transcription antitermination protein NusB n=1 Tax=Actinomadura parmotrematis TaxID=2864039 RepID=A0ABS7FKW7_9ACTN|nr:transcription antitermination factor NusB [Actinomadura parmotrematis]MBW8481004.1 transcription antitermination factor NusB [Actinomadura parmotrematis]